MQICNRTKITALEHPSDPLIRRALLHAPARLYCGVIIRILLNAGTRKYPKARSIHSLAAGKRPQQQDQRDAGDE